MSDDSNIRPDEQRLIEGVELLKATEGSLTAEHRPGRLTAEHAAYLEAHAVDIELAERLGVRSLVGREDTKDLPGVWPNWANFPAILLPWTTEDGREYIQVRPDRPTNDPKNGRPRKYVFAGDSTPVLWALRPLAGAPMIIIEGSKQGLAGASWLPAGFAVYSIAGCRSWQHDGAPIPDLGLAQDRDVIIMLDADAGTNIEVFNAGTDLAAALKLEGATSVKFAHLPGVGKAGLDDVLAKRAPEKRTAWLTQILASATTKPAEKKPTRKRPDQPFPETKDGRPTIVCNRDRLDVINDLTTAMVEKRSGKDLFDHGGVISRRIGGEMHPVEKGMFNDIVQLTAYTVNENNSMQGITYSPTWPDAQTMSAVISRTTSFASLDRISHAPFVRPDGSIVFTPGYDEATRTMLLPDPVFEGIQVPGVPTAEDVTAARDLIMNDWLGDFPFDGDADRANALALILTPAVRGLLPRAPMCVVDGLQMGVGKNLLADCLLTVYTGETAKPLNFVDEPEEMRKQITSAFRTGQEFFVFDEAHTLDGTALAQALTAETWQDRILGVSTMANFPNRVTWMSLGNNVQVKGDITRRVYRVALRPTYANPQDRPASSFRHPGVSGLDLGSWTRAHRRELMAAILTLIRAWFSAGSPSPTRSVSFGSFEQWERMLGGIVELAGMPGFLTNIKVWRSESDFYSQYWLGHLKWLKDLFGAKSFKTGEVRSKAIGDLLDYQAPPNLDDPADRAFGKALGEAYSRIRGRRFEGYWIEKDGNSHGHVAAWRVHEVNEAPPEPDPDTMPEPPAPDPSPVDEPVDNPEPEVPVKMFNSDGWIDPVQEIMPEPEPVQEITPEPELEPEPAAVLTFDLETGDAGDLFKTPADEYVRLGGWAADDRPVQVRTIPDAAAETTAAFWGSGEITGHNIMAFDLPALVRGGQITMTEIHRMAAEGRIFDTLLAARYLDPPMAREKGVDSVRKYDLGNLGQRYDLGEKLTDISKALAKKYGGWAAIPIDLADPDPERAADAADFHRYLVGDVELSRNLHEKLMEDFDGVMPDYLVREHRVAAIASQISVNGFLVDEPELRRRVAEVDKRKADAYAMLSAKYDLPLKDPKGRAYASPLSTKAGKVAIENALLHVGVKPSSIWRTEKSGEFMMSGEHMLQLGRDYPIPAVREIAKAVYRVVGARSVYQTALDNLCPDGRVHPAISFEQATGRWSVTRPGLTVFGKRGGRHVERAVFLPDPGEVIISVDLSQVDMRAVAGLSQDQAYIEMLKHDDPHAQIALALFGDVKFREVAKSVGHGWNYGRSVRAISEKEEIEPRLVVQFDRSMRERYGRLVEWQGEVRAWAESGELLDNGFGRKMRPDPHRAHTQGPALAGQGAARDIMMTGLLALPAEIMPMLRAQVHDEIVLSVPIDQAAEISRTVVDALSFEWRGVPIEADASPVGSDWSKCYEK